MFSLFRNAKSEWAFSSCDREGAVHGFENRFPTRRFLSMVAFLSVLMAVSCKREARKLRDEPPERGLYVTARESPLEPGGKQPDIGMKSDAEGNAYQISQGQRLFNWFNCSGCHAQGGGGMGPPLMDANFLYGSSPENIYDTIVKGRPNGMPSWGGRIPENQIWQLVAYVRSLSGSEPMAATGARTDTIEKKTKAQLN
jgi:cytochrome c oxidase cbb3-type subunit 3